MLRYVCIVYVNKDISINLFVNIKNIQTLHLIPYFIKSGYVPNIQGKYNL